ncbi:histidine phosphatase family protein [Microbacterium sp. HMWF026]|uniref:histidine phosphatase family protein n=1 Tax=Microbacterium sp. HMWF026 TaxID=2056861 RepID=UPI000D350E2D|nr:histidine phosphatase family protein [Microbacterium sp. HMWF026]PTT19416.1 histidine phosphatase family protein [Microbacterium sp. HMWF026]
MTRIALARHGQTVWHDENRYAGRSDIDLTETGVAQGRDLAAWASSAGVTSIASSTLRRAIRTAALSAETTRLTPGTDPRLVEIDFGRGEGLTISEMEATFPDAAASFRARPATSPLPGGEDPASAAERFIDGLADLSDADPTGLTLVVAHTTVIRLALCALVGVPLDEYRRIFPALGNCTITEIDFTPSTRRAALLTLNAPPTPVG